MTDSRPDDNQTRAPDDRGVAADWRIYRGTGQPHREINRLPPPPRWRVFDGGPVVRPRLASDRTGEEKARAYQASDEVIEMVNAALYLRRPLLVTGKPGTGKSTLAYSIAYELSLGPVLYWPITSRATLQDGLYRYDAIGRLQETNLYRVVDQEAAADVLPSAEAPRHRPRVPDIGRYLTLGALGSALIAQERPRVLLVDELDKSNIDLPNDLLNVFEEGWFDIPELSRLADEQNQVEVMIADSIDRVPVSRGRVKCRAFPIVVITSNGEREFPPAFLRRCLRVDIKPPDERTLEKIIVALLGEPAVAGSYDIIQQFLDSRDRSDLATDQLLNAIYLTTSGIRQPESTRARLRDALLRPLDSTGA
jgi:MoxR-like ATPase